MDYFNVLHENDAAVQLTDRALSPAPAVTEFADASGTAIRD